MELERGGARAGLADIDEALAFVQETGERFWETEIHRLKGSRAKFSRFVFSHFPSRSSSRSRNGMRRSMKIPLRPVLRIGSRGRKRLRGRGWADGQMTSDSANGASMRAGGDAAQALEMLAPVPADDTRRGKVGAKPL
jgi:hypothetical protein